MPVLTISYQGGYGSRPEGSRPGSGILFAQQGPTDLRQECQLPGTLQLVERTYPRLERHIGGREVDLLAHPSQGLPCQLRFDSTERSTIGSRVPYES